MTLSSVLVSNTLFLIVTLQSLSDAVAGVEEASPRGAVQLEVDLTITQTVRESTLFATCLQSI